MGQYPFNTILLDVELVNKRRASRLTITGRKKALQKSRDSASNCIYNRMLPSLCQSPVLWSGHKVVFKTIKEACPAYVEFFNFLFCISANDCSIVADQGIA